jgi:hypothetical protein
MPFPFERLRERLLYAGVSPRHVRRYMAELSDHVADLEDEAKRSGHPRPEASALERLGRPDDLAKAMIERTELRAWTARAPWAVFLFGPSLLLVVIDILSILSMMAIVKMFLPQVGQPAPGWLITLSTIVNGLHAYAVPLLLGWAIAIVATRQRMPPLWPVIGLAVIAGLAAINQLHIDVPLARGQHGEIGLGANIGTAAAIRAVINLTLTLPLYFAWRRWQPALTL